MSCVRQNGQWHGDTPKATDFFSEDVEVIDLSHDRPKGTKGFFQKEIKLLLQVSIAFYVGRGLNLLRRKQLGLTSGAIWGDL